MALVTYPLNDVDYSAEDAELFHCTRTSGIYANDDFDYSVTGADNTITVGVGLAWIRNSRFSGKVAALKAALSLDLGVPDAVYPRIDAVVLQFDANANSTEIVVKQGTAASSPAAPAVSRTEALYELHLYHVRREAGAAAIAVSNVTDLRLDSNYCGLMADSVTQIDTDAIAAQARALIEELRTELEAVKDGSAYMLKGETADAAEKLSTARTVQVDLGSEDAASFDGTADIKPGVTGALPIKHGGHGATDAETARKNLGAASAAIYTGTLPASGWAYEDSAGCYTQTISVEGLLATDDIVFDLGATSVENQLILADEWAPIYGAVPSDGSFFIRVRYLPSIDVPVKFICVRG